MNVYCVYEGGCLEDGVCFYAAESSEQATKFYLREHPVAPGFYFAGTAVRIEGATAEGPPRELKEANSGR